MFDNEEIVQITNDELPEVIINLRYAAYINYTLSFIMGLTPEEKTEKFESFFTDKVFDEFVDDDFTFDDTLEVFHEYVKTDGPYYILDMQLSKKLIEVATYRLAITKANLLVDEGFLDLAVDENGEFQFIKKRVR